MHRVGTTPEDLRDVAAAVLAEPGLQLEGIWTHLPVADGEHDADIAFTEGQLDLFDRLVTDLAAAGISVPLLHAANTAGAIAFPARATPWCAAASASTATCPGAAVQAAFDEQARGEQLRPVMSLKARVVAVRTLDAGERPSYGRLRPLPARSRSPPSPSGTPTACRGHSSTAATRC